MFAHQKIDLLFNELNTLLPAFPAALTNLIPPYSIDSEWEREDKQDELKKIQQKIDLVSDEIKQSVPALPDEEFKNHLPGQFSTNKYLFFKNCFYGNLLTSTCVSGIVIGIFITMYIGIPFLIVDFMINICFLDEDTMGFYMTKIPYYLCATIGTIIGLILSIIPALILCPYQTIKRPTGEEIYNLLKTLECEIYTNKNQANNRITRIIASYKDDFFMYPASLRPRDKNSEELYNLLESNAFSLQEKGTAIANYMATKNKNAGKDLFNIILKELKKSNADYSALYSSSTHFDPGFYFF